MDEKAAAFGEWLRTEIDRRGWSVSDFARHAGVGTGLAGNWLTGKRRPKPASCERIAAALDLNPDVVLAAAGHRPLRDGPTRYELERRLRELETLMRNQVRVIEEEIELEEGPLIPYYGVVPADAVRWVAAQEKGEPVRVRGDYIGTRSPNDFLIVDASGDCLLTSYGHIASGDQVLLERLQGRQPRDGEIVLVRVGEEYSLKLWHRQGDFIELRDGDGRPICRLSMLDEFAVIGVFVARWTKPRT